MISFTSHDAFCEYIGQQLSRKDHADNAFVIMRHAYTQKELIKRPWTTEVLELDQDGDYCWLNDYYEGEQFYQVAAVMLADELADFVTDRLYYHLGG